MKQQMVDLKELERFRDAHVGLEWGQSVSIGPDPNDAGAVLVSNDRGQPCGVLPRRGSLCKEILAGAKIGHISWQMIDRGPDGQLSRLRVPIVTVNEGEHFEMPPKVEPKQYPVGIVGEASYQPAIRRCSNGQRVSIVHELGNPYDKNALAVVTESGETIGYIGRDSWLQEAVHDQGHGCEAMIKEVRASGGGKFGVVLDVTVSGHSIATRQFNRSAPTSVEGSVVAKGCLARLLGL
jgi:hypothetical protein